MGKIDFLVKECVDGFDCVTIGVTNNWRFQHSPLCDVATVAYGLCNVHLMLKCEVWLDMNYNSSL